MRLNVTRYKLYHSVGKQILAQSWVSLCTVTSMPLALILVTPVSLLIHGENHWALALELVAASYALGYAVGLPFWGKIKYGQMLNQFGQKESHRFLRWLIRDKSSSFTFTSNRLNTN